MFDWNCVRQMLSHLFYCLRSSDESKKKTPHQNMKNYILHLWWWIDRCVYEYVPSLNFSSKNTSATTADKTAQITKLVTWNCILCSAPNAIDVWFWINLFLCLVEKQFKNVLNVKTWLFYKRPGLFSFPAASEVCIFRSNDSSIYTPHQIVWLNITIVWSERTTYVT